MTLRHFSNNYSGAKPGHDIAQQIPEKSCLSSLPWRGWARHIFSKNYSGWCIRIGIKFPPFHVCIWRKVVHPRSSDHKQLNKQEAFNGADCSGTRLMMSWLPMPCVPDTTQWQVSSHAQNRILSATDVVPLGQWATEISCKKGLWLAKDWEGHCGAPPLTERQLGVAQRQMQANEALLLCSCRAGGDGEQGERRQLSPSGLRLWVTTRQRPLDEIPLRDVVLIGLGAIIQGLDRQLTEDYLFVWGKKKCSY